MDDAKQYAGYLASLKYWVAIGRMKTQMIDNEPIHKVEEILSTSGTPLPSITVDEHNKLVFNPTRPEASTAQS